MLIENFIRKRDIYTGFYFDYALDEEDHISRLFWADAISRKNYCLFGEMVTFDCTYNTNKYSMVLAPFIGVDHHKCCITFGIGLLAKEDSESFEWLFMTFLHCMGECMPTYLITDQDLAMKIAIKNRYKQDKLNAESLHTNPQYKTPLSIEKHAGEVYTRKFFFLFQYEVYKSCFKTYIQNIEKIESVESITVLDSTVSKMYKVKFILGSSIDELKVDYRWTKLALKKPIFDLHGNLIEESKKYGNVGKLLGEVWCEILNCVGLAQRGESDLQSLLQNLKDISRKLEESDDVRVDITKEQQIELLVGTSSSSTMEI
ncbi:protein FAR-RED ELONGATED HYPOCOTYL 3-like [Amaranthus tricolor]|uniref:protein FAR-RED ELONGATED HYPOCOTYL 3-like n=1 Tax=Amaranthus tricolor TaxID=29722 RepID=UPI00258988FA|nr:protein FAR-RED ELONGATED HYPOCOTYL 3-like [Amaranthus tricolor]